MLQLLPGKDIGSGEGPKTTLPTLGQFGHPSPARKIIFRRGRGKSAFLVALEEWKEGSDG